MKRTAVGWVLLVLAVGALATAGWLGFAAVNQLRANAASIANVNELAVSAQVGLSALRQSVAGAADAYRGRVVTSGVLARRDTVQKHVAALRDAVSDGDVLNNVEAAASELQGFSTPDEEFDEDAWRRGLDTLTAAQARIEAARQSEMTAAAARAEALYLRVAGAAGGAGVITLLALLLAPMATKPRQIAVDTTPERGSLDASSSLALTDTIAPVESSPPEPQPGLTETQVSQPGTAVVEQRPRHDRRKATELRALAALCGDFARLRDSVELPGLLERAARAMDASGFIVWICDASRTHLKPALAHGYSAQALARMPTLPRDGRNPTSQAWRDVTLQVVQTNGMTPGAIVVPMVGPDGCVGVLAAEVVHGRESSAAVAATAEIVGAMLATLVSAPIESTVGAPAADGQRMAIEA
ncbi:MAG: hypothetical protein AB7I50_03860 [Vicinamibacterales bacterium]